MIKKYNNERHLIILEENSKIPDRKSANYIFATIGSEIRCDKDIFDNYSHEGWSDLHHDLLIVCAAVEFADRRWARGNVCWSRHLKITVPVLELSVWKDKNVYNTLRSTINHITGDIWHFDFIKYSDSANNNSRQVPFIFDQKKKFVMAYSEGLDSLCVAGIYDHDDISVKVRVSKNKQHAQKGEQPFDRLPYAVKVRPNLEDSVRSRGFKFAAISAIAAQLSEIDRIIIPESGQGALGPVLLPLLGIYPDYRNHPTFFRKMERFIKALLGVDICFEQPRLWFTKSQTIAEFQKKTNADFDLLIKTRSCWQQRFNIRVRGKLLQCGICAACLLRRMSLHAAGITDPQENYAIGDLKVEQFNDALPNKSVFKSTSTLFEYGYTGARHLKQLADLYYASDQFMRPHIFQLAEALGTSMGKIEDLLSRMLHQHFQEWQAFEANAGEKSYLRAWTLGDRHG